MCVTDPEGERLTKLLVSHKQFSPLSPLTRAPPYVMIVRNHRINGTSGNKGHLGRGLVLKYHLSYDMCIMLGNILNLFGRSPFASLLAHMEKVSTCVHLLPQLFDALEQRDYKNVEELSNKIADIEHQADIAKNDIRNHLPKSLVMPIDRGHLLEILNIQDKIADKAEDVAVLVTLKTIELLPVFKDEFMKFLRLNMETFDGARRIIKEMHELLESSFGGLEAEKVCAMVEEVSYKEHEVDMIQRQLLKKIFSTENEMTYTSFLLWQKICQAVGEISNLSENLAFRVRMTLELK